MTDTVYNPRSLWLPKRPQLKEQCRSCPFRSDNDEEFGEFIVKLRALHSEPPPKDSREMKVALAVARHRAQKDLEHSGDFICHHTAYDETMDMKDMESFRQCPGATKFFKEQGRVKAIESKEKSGQARRKRSSKRRTG